MKMMIKIYFILLLTSTLIVGCDINKVTAEIQCAPKIIIDSDFNSIGDDGQLLVMAVQLMAVNQVDLLGLTVVTGNGWLLQEQAEALKAVERLGVETTVGVYAGANYPLHYDEPGIRSQQKSNPNGYFGAWMYKQPMSSAELQSPSDGFSTHTVLQKQSAVDFIITMAKKYPHEVSVLEVGPPTNLALALQKAPEISKLLKQVIYMGGAMEVAGNANAVAELNWWFDPLATRQLLHSDIPQVIIPLDVTNKVPLDKKSFERITADPGKQTAVTRLYASENAQALGQNTHIYDTLTIAWLIDASFAIVIEEAWLDIDTSDGETQGKVLVNKTGPTETSSKNKIRYVTEFDNSRFMDLYIDLLTRPVPVVLTDNCNTTTRVNLSGKLYTE